MSGSESAEPYFAIVIGSGFAGAVTACRLTEAWQGDETGKRVLMLERGRRYQPDEFPLYPDLGPVDDMDESGAAEREAGLPDLGGALWRAGGGPWEFRDLGDLVVAQAAGVGGGSLIYANVHLRAPKQAFAHYWPEAYTGDALAGYYDLAAFMLQVGRTPDKEELPKLRALQSAAASLPRNEAPVEAFRMPLAVTFEDSDDNPFEVEAKPCDMRGDCVFGCGRGAKNSLDRNYLTLAERQGLELRASTEVVSIEPHPDGGYVVLYEGQEGPGRDRACHVFLCAGAVNTTELLLRSREIWQLPIASAELGKRFFPNADTVAAVFDCDDAQECDRGPTITAGMLYDRAPDDRDPSARWLLEFSEGRVEPLPRSRVVGVDSGASAVIAADAVLRVDAWSEGNAAGELVLSQLEGDFRPGEELQLLPPDREDHEPRDKRFALVASTARKSSHWFLIQDGGLPEPLTPLLGVLRSPLWVRRNRFLELDEEPAARDDGAASRQAVFRRSVRQGFAELPARSVSDLAAALAPRARNHRQLMSNEVTGSLARSGVSWKELLPTDLADALEKDREELIARFSDAAERFVSDFLRRAASKIEDRYPLDDILGASDAIEFGGKLDVSELDRLHLGRQALELAVQVAFGSQAMLANDAARMLLEIGDPDTSRELAANLLRWALDYRIDDGHSSVLLSMGRDSLPGQLALEVAQPPRPGSIISGGWGAEAILVGLEAEGSWGLARAKGSLFVAPLRGALAPDEPIFWGDSPLGSVKSVTKRGNHLWQVRFEPQDYADPKAQRDARQRAERRLRHARLGARLPHSFDTPERAMQERRLRDIARIWRGELRTNPSSGFLGRHFTVHAQGGCAMGRNEGEGVTDAEGAVRGCEGLYVMDAAAFPSSIGVNPSATITAIAEYKVEKFIRSKLPGQANWKASHTTHATKYAKARPWLDPFAGAAPTAPPASEPVGIAFDEEMTGAMGAQGEPEKRDRISTEFHVEVRDLARFLEHERRGDPQGLAVTGEVSIEQADGTTRTLQTHAGEQSYIRLERIPRAESRRWRRILYHVVLDDGKGRRWTLDGSKPLIDDPGFEPGELWTDTTELFFELTGPDGTVAEGVLKVPLHVFLEKQLRSFRATGTADRARQSWALAAFGRYFFGQLVDVYLPELDDVVDVVQRVVERSHG